MKPEWKDFFDNPNQTFNDPEDQELANLFNKVSEMKVPDPGSDYWNSFNERLQNNLEKKPQNIGIFHALKSLFFQQLWFKGAIWALMICCIGLVSFYVMNTNEKSFSEYGFGSLASLNQDDLQLLGDLMPTDDTLTYVDTQNFWSDDSVNDLYQDSDEIYIDLDFMDLQTLESLFEEEG